MATTAFWAPNQGPVAQVETGTFTIPSGAGNTYSATINGKSVTYSANATDGLTAAAAATGLYNLLIATKVPEFNEITWANPSSGVVTATAKTPGTPFANVTGTSAGLVFSTGNGLANGITQAHTTANASPSDVNDAQNWLRVTNPAPGVRQLPQNGDDVVIANTAVPMLWNLAALAAVQFATYTRWQSFEGTIGLPENNPNGYTEWRETYFKFSGPQGSVPSGGLQMILGQGTAGQGPTRERYNTASNLATLTAIAAGTPDDEYGIRWLTVHTQSTFTALGGVSLGIAMLPGEVANLASCTMDGSATVGIGSVTWTAASTLTVLGGSVILNAAPATINTANGASLTFMKDGLTWTTISAQGGCQLTWLCGGTITTLTLATASTVDKSADARGLTITNSTLDGDTCFIDDPLNAVTFTNATTVRESVGAGPIRFTGNRTMKVT